MIPALLVCASLHQQPSPTGITLTPGMTLSRSSSVVSKVYRLSNDAENGKEAAIYVRGDNIVIDFKGATLEGTAPTVEPSERKGTGILVTGKNVTLKNLKVRGYKLGVVAVNSPGLRIHNVDASYNWKQRLLSNQDREDTADWMSYHQNEKDEWLRYGAAFYLRGCDDVEIKDCKAVGGQCGLMLTQSNKGLIWNNDFSFLSAIGIGMYRSSENRIMHNKIDWCLRGFSYGVYNRGQDSAGILIYEQSNKNVFAYNSVTHSGDGFFLWAGQTTMDTGKGGCNDNLLYGNDWSHAPTNGIEATFSRNNFVNNLIMECWHGIWGGYSFNSKVLGNIFAYNTEGIAWEHGQENLVRGNTFFRDGTALNIWMNEREDPNWGYAKARDTKSRDWTIEGNTFAHTTLGPRVVSGATQDLGAVLKMSATTNLHFGSNKVGPSGTLFDLRGPSKNFTADAGSTLQAPIDLKGLGSGWGPESRGQYYLAGSRDGLLPPASSLTANRDVLPDKQEYTGRFVTTWNPFDRTPNRKVTIGTLPAGKDIHTTSPEVVAFAPAPLKGGMDPFLKKGQQRGWLYMIVDEWGPYDFKRPLLWPRGTSTRNVEGMDGVVRRNFEILGPPGKFKVVKVEGVKGIDGMKVGDMGQVPGFIHVLQTNSAKTVDIELEYIGAETTDYRGIVTPAGKPVRFGFSQFFAPIDWDVKIYPWDKSKVASPRDKMPTPREVLSADELAKPVKSFKTDKLDYASGGSLVPGGPTDNFITLAEGTFEIPAGDYVLNITIDDGARVWLDDKLILDEWHWQGPTNYPREVKLGGKHKLRVEHYEIDGYTALKVEIVKK